MSGLVIAMLLAMLDNMIVAPALPTIVGELGGLNHLAWVTTGYILASTVATSIWGKLGDLYGRRVTFLSAVALFLFGSVLRGLPQAARELFQHAVTDGVTALFATGAIVAVAGIVAALFIKQIPLRGAAAPASAPSTAPERTPELVGSH